MIHIFFILDYCTSAGAIAEGHHIGIARQSIVLPRYGWVGVRDKGTIHTHSTEQKVHSNPQLSGVTTEGLPIPV